MGEIFLKFIQFRRQYWKMERFSKKRVIKYQKENWSGRLVISHRQVTRRSKDQPNWWRRICFHQGDDQYNL